ncbi:mechanosensitive ion channel domain-containing protein [Stieleria varia]|uniref:Small-conductance mechanosensitive channel n=1 Tax=Stieleria varia TaxID=2528005 RepID=A0A5C5ZZB7_9BACT|nr:mechanosensitive ion channel domain-containing protein [Stieleria varia]TWT92420.1 Small-conductance mechanosensitive channel [Stieleria varia]
MLNRIGNIAWLILLVAFIFPAAVCVPVCVPVSAQDNGGKETDVSPDGTVEVVGVAQLVEVVPDNSDLEIERRLAEIMEATGWFRGADINVEYGVVFLSGTADSESHRQWAEQTAMHTRDVVAVVNRITVTEKPLFDLTPARKSLREMLRDFLTSLPLLVVAVIVILTFYLLAKLSARITRRFFSPETDSKLLRQVVATVIGVLVFLIGLHIALRVSGLTRLATTLLGGTGLIGLAIGFAFRDIAENFLSSVLLSLQHPFCVGDLIEVNGTTGFVRRVTTRATILATFEGNQVQIPNSIIYKGQITNFSTSPLRRQSFAIGIGYDDSVQGVQEMIMEVLTSHPAVLNEPEPTVLVDSLGSSTVNLQCRYWFNQQSHSGDRVKSALIRQTKQTLRDAGVVLPDEAREIVFPDAVPIQLLRRSDADPRNSLAKRAHKKLAHEPTESPGEGDLHSDAEDVVAVLGEVPINDSENILETPTTDPPNQ